MERDAGVGVVRLDLLDRLKALCSAFREQRGVECRLEVRPEHTRLEAGDADVLYQSIRELLTLYKQRLQITEIVISSELRPDGSVVFHVEDGAAARARGTGDPDLAQDGVALWNIDQRLRESGAYLELKREVVSCASVVFPGRLLVVR
jgi:signal transduction histidine kinase